MSFNGAAQTYDQDFTHTSLGEWLRARVWSRMDALFSPSMRVLELGCGTGEDAVYLAQKGVQVLATDASPEMLKITQQKAARVGVKIETQIFDFNDRSTWQLSGQFDGVYSNFGAINCTQRWRELADYLAGHTSDNARLGFGVMSRFCLFESLWHGAHLDFGTATRRWSGQNIATLDDGSTLEVYYPFPRGFSEAFAPRFSPRAVVGMGVLMPTSDAYAVFERFPLGWMLGLERILSPRLPAIADHFWIELEKDRANT